MPQVLKDEVRARLLAAAGRVFAERGYAGATMTAIAERAGVGTASTYRYFAGKRELFDALVTPEVVRRFESLLERRVRALGRGLLAGGARAGVAPPAFRLARRGGERGRSAGDDLGDEMLRFWLERRLEVVILLDRAAGTPYARFGERFVELLVGGTLASLAEGGRSGPSAATRFVLERIFENTRRALAAILEAHEDEATLREAIEAFWSYQLAGLRGLAGWLGRGR